jgi:hypothetical protein
VVGLAFVAGYVVAACTLVPSTYKKGLREGSNMAVNGAANLLVEGGYQDLAARIEKLRLT